LEVSRRVQFDRRIAKGVDDMSREIVYRGFDHYTVKWLYGQISEYISASGTGHSVTINDLQQGTHRQIELDSLSQWTTFRDKNGKPIFEEDIVLYGNKYYIVAKANCFVGTPHLAYEKIPDSEWVTNVYDYYYLHALAIHDHVNDLEEVWRGFSEIYLTWQMGFLQDQRPTTIRMNGFYSYLADSLGNWIGINDKNGNKIFEGDFIKTGSGKLLKIEFGQTFFQNSFVFDPADADLEVICHAYNPVYNAPTF
jgi:hypothetical protein